MDREPESEETTFDIDALKSALDKSRYGLIPVIESIYKITRIEQLIDYSN